MGLVSDVYKAYSSKPTSFIFPLVAFLFYGAVTFFVMLFIYENIYLVIKSFGLGSDVQYGIIGLLGVAYLYFLSGFKGGMLKGFFTAADRRGRFDTSSFITFSLNNAGKFFLIYLLQAVVNVLIVGPLFYILLSNLDNTVLVVLISLAIIFFLILINYLLFYAALAVVVFDGIRTSKAIVGSVKAAIMKLPELIAPYIFYLITLLTFIIPLVNLVTLFLLYPIAMATAMMALKRVSSFMARYL